MKVTSRASAEVACEPEGPVAVKGASSGGLPWTQAFVETLPLAPFWGGVALTAAQLSLCFVYRAGFGEPQRLMPDLVFALLIGLGPTASIYARRATLACLRDLRPALDVSDPRFPQLASDVTRWDPFWARFSGIASVIVSVIVVLNEPGVVESYPVGHPMLPLVLWMNVASIWLCTRTITQEVIVSRRISRLGRDHAVVDLLDPTPLTPFARRGVQGALVPIVIISVFSLLFVSGSAGDAVPFTQAFVVAIAAASLIIPVHGVHLRLAQQKRERLARVGAAIRAVEGPVLGARPGEAASQAAHLHALLALRGQLESAREWPWDVPTLVRFALYVAIGVGSWLGGALVERVLDVVLE